MTEIDRRRSWPSAPPLPHRACSAGPPGPASFRRTATRRGHPRHHSEPRRGEWRGRSPSSGGCRARDGCKSCPSIKASLSVRGPRLVGMARPIDTGGVYQLLMFTGRDGAVMPRHLHRGATPHCSCSAGMSSSSWMGARIACFEATSRTSRRAPRTGGRCDPIGPRSRCTRWAIAPVPHLPRWDRRNPPTSSRPTPG